MKKRARPIACVLSIAGSDSGGGAGIQADLKTFAALRVHGASAISCLTAQNPRRVLAVQPVQPAFLKRQLEAIFSELSPAAIKTGMLYSADLVRAVAGFLRSRDRLPLVVDPVMVATSRARLLDASAVRVLIRDLIPLAALLTPNLDEAEALLGTSIRSVEAMRAAAQEIYKRFGCAALVKGGHLGGAKAVDVFFDGCREKILTANFVRGMSTHGTGCTYSAAIAAWLARGKSLPEAVGRAKGFVTRAIRGSRWVSGRHWVLDPR